MLFDLLFAAESDNIDQCLEARRSMLLAEASYKVDRAKYLRIQLEKLLKKGLHEQLPTISQQEQLDIKIKLSREIQSLKIKLNLGDKLYNPLPKKKINISDCKFWKFIYRYKHQTIDKTIIINKSIRIRESISKLRELLLKYKVDLENKKVGIIYERTQKLCQLLKNTPKDINYYREKILYFQNKLVSRCYLNYQDYFVQEQLISWEFPNITPYNKNTYLSIMDLEKLLGIKKMNNKKADYLPNDRLVKSLQINHKLQLIDKDAIAYFLKQNYPECILNLGYEEQEIMEASNLYIAKTSRSELQKLVFGVESPTAPQIWLDYPKAQEDLYDIAKELWEKQYQDMPRAFFFRFE